MAERERRNTMPPAGILELVNDHTRRLNGVEDRERSLKDELHGIKLAVDRCERPLKTISWVVTTVGALLIALIVGGIYKMFSFRLPEPLPPAGSSERLAPDRAEPPLGQHAP